MQTCILCTFLYKKKTKKKKQKTLNVYHERVTESPRGDREGIEFELIDRGSVGRERTPELMVISHLTSLNIFEADSGSFFILFGVKRTGVTAKVEGR